MRKLSAVCRPSSVGWLLRPPTTGHRPPACRRGTTLSEVLVSTLVMSIGVVALATLFPISVLRSIQASQLTNAAILRYNAESFLKTVPEVINIGREWEPGTTYQTGDIVVPTATTQQKFPASAAYIYSGNPNVTSGPTEPLWVNREGATTADGPSGNTFEWRTILLRNHVVDPLGFLLVDPSDPPPTGFANYRGTGLTGTREHFGHENGNPFLQLGNRTTNRFPVFGAYRVKEDSNGDGQRDDINNEIRAALLTVLPDSWTLQAEALEVAYTPGNTNILMGRIDATQLVDSVQVGTPASPDLIPDRIVIFDETLRRSHTFPVIGITPNAQGAVVDWAGGSALPTDFVPAKARVESLERRYSYILSVRQRRSYCYIDVVVFFRRQYGMQDEQVYSCVFRKIDRGADGAPGNVGDDDGDGKGDNVDTSELNINGELDDDNPRNFCIVQYHSSHTSKPFFKKGSYICDIHNLRWYRVIDVAEDPLPPFLISHVTPSGYEVDPVGIDPVSGQPNDRFVRLTLGEPVVDDSPMNVPGAPFTPLQFRNGTVDTTGTVGGAVLMRGIVDVFPITPRSTWEQ